jgi:endonuclease/exonuclease/phosphatase family metal-dependent hydrolase
VKISRILSHVLQYVNLALAFLLLLCYLSVYVSPKFFWQLAFLGLAYPYILFINIIAVVFWIIFRKKEFLISLVVIALGWNFMARILQVPFHFHKTREAESISLNYSPPVQLKVLSYNVRAFNLYNWANDPEAESKILELLRTQKADVICLQEFFTREKGEINRKELMRMLSGTPFNHIYNFPSEDMDYRHGIVIFSIYPILNKGILLFGNTSNLSIYADILVNKDTFRIYNNHLQSIHFIKRNYDFMDTLKFKYTNRQVGEIRDISVRLRDAFIKRAMQVDMIGDHIKNCPYPVILCGDFNDTPVSYTYQRLSRNLDDAFIESGKGFGNTYKGIFPSFRIDYILYSRKFRCSGFATLKRNFSDHFPLVARLIFKN